MVDPGHDEAEGRCLASLSVAACALDRALTLLHPNSAAVDLLRLPHPAPASAAFLDHVHPFDRASIAPDLEAAFRDERATVLSCRVGFENKWSLIDLHLGPAARPEIRLIVMVPKRFSAPGAGRPSAAEGNHTARKAAPEGDQAEEWRRFAYTVAHDLKVPLVTMESNLRLMQQDLVAGRAGSLKDDLAEVGEAVQKMKRLVVELLDLARIGRLDLIAAAHSRATDDIDLNEIVDQVARDVLLGNPGWKGSLKRVNDLPMVRGRATQLTEVFQNLIDNAVKYSSRVDSPRVEIDSDFTGDVATVSVRDNGCGIPRQDRNRVFDLFVQLRPDAAGVGIGLAIVRSIISSHGGRVWIEEGLDGRGSSFCVVLHSRA